jgi:hypothetical protein
LGKPVHADTLLVENVSKRSLMTDYAWKVSADRKAWRTVYDTAAPRAGRLKALGPLTNLYQLSDLGRFRYLGLDLRQSKARDRLFLRKLAVFRKSPLDLTGRLPTF